MLRPINKITIDRESEQGTAPVEAAEASTSRMGAEQTRYRIASVAQDCQLLFWDFTAEEEDYLADLNADGQL